MRRARTWMLLFAGIVAGLVVVAVAPSHAQERDPDDAARSQAAFRDVARVLRHPRCLNCHPAGDRPKVGEAGTVHLQNVQRGPKNHGMAGLHCGTCHQSENQDLARVPGAPHWSLAPRSMGWEGLDDHGLAETLKDRKRNGDRSLADLLAHVRHDPLVKWGWKPGRGRAPVPLAHDEFVRAFETWIRTGAVSPARGTTSRFPAPKK